MRCTFLGFFTWGKVCGSGMHEYCVSILQVYFYECIVAPYVNGMCIFFAGGTRSSANIAKFHPPLKLPVYGM